ncbi:MAG: histidine kinase [Saprospiraceae bacterium]|nr:histidine kinase [Saprospiraceae bacterium]
MILISKAQRITSIADFIASRYGKSTALGIIATVISIVGIVPYIALQLKAIVDSFNVLLSLEAAEISNTVNVGAFNYYTLTFYLAMVLALFAVLFGTRKLDPSERHEGIVAAVAFESIIKLVAFMAVGIFVTYSIYNGFGDLFSKAIEHQRIIKAMTPNPNASSEWFSLALLSACAVILLPRQFHIAVVENTQPNHVLKALWLFPLYMLLINIFVIPIAFAGLMQLGEITSQPDYYVLALPLINGQKILGLLVFIGGFSAAASMVIVETTALSIMISNHLVLPPLLSQLARRDGAGVNVAKWLIFIRRIVIFGILLLAYVYVKTIVSSLGLVSIGLTSFVAVAQFAPSVFLGLFWKKGTKTGAICGLIIGFLMWAITLPLPNLAEYGLIDPSVLTQGYGGFSLLKPYALFGLTDFDHITHATFWSLLFNVGVYVVVSLNTSQTSVEILQADYFVNFQKYQNVSSSEYDLYHREAKVDDLVFLLTRFIGTENAQATLKNYENEHQTVLKKLSKADEGFISFVETHLAGALGTASAKILISSVAKEETISLDEMLNILDRTQELVMANFELERKSKELAETTRQLKEANELLQQLDRLKADFITTVTHELRTPMTSIKAFSKILLDNPNLSKEKNTEFLNIVVSETERITRLINQVLDIEKLQSKQYNWRFDSINLSELVLRAYNSLLPVFLEKNIDNQILMPEQKLVLRGDTDALIQVFVNILSNATKFANTQNGIVKVLIEEKNGLAIVSIKDNGVGIPTHQQELIFQRFTQIDDPQMGKPKGSGLGLYISKEIIEYHNGRIYVESEAEKGANFIIELPIVNQSIV